MSTRGSSPPRSGDVAVVGMSCRLAGGVSTLDDFWTLLSRSRDGWRTIPNERFSSDAYYHPNPQKKGCFNQKGGYFMDKDFSEFDAPFFQITEQEALAMDPQQRQLLECSYEALENAGLAKESLSGSNMGVFVGAASSGYRMGTLKDLSQVPMFDATGNHQSIQAGRISYYFNLSGPSFSIDTACSSSLYALHLAVQSIRSGESDSALVAGCSLHLNPDDMISMSMLGIFSDHGRTYAFDHRAKSGYARGEGAGCVILKPLEKALEDNDNIRSIIVNTGTNQDGKTVGISTPSGEAQERLIRDVYARANISTDDVGFVEAHGTGTRIGDPIEAGAIKRVFGNGRTKRSPLYMGSVKTNVGHLENASGIISIIKATLMLEKGFILPNVNYEKPNPAIPLDEWNIKIPTSLRPWPKNKKYVSINNFGFGGSNAHAILKARPSAYADFVQDTKTELDKPRLFVLSAHDEGAAKRVAAQLGIFIEQHPEVFQKRLIKDIAYTLGERRSHLAWRVALAASSCDELATSLNGIDAIPSRISIRPSLAFVFTGQGAQWPRMGCELLETHPIFATAIETASKYLTGIGADFNLLDELCKSADRSNVSKAHISQPICTAVQLGLVALLSSWGIEPSMVMGHSSGEIAAAYSTGAITLEEAMAVAYHRGQVSSDMKVKNSDLRGAMLAVGAGPYEVKAIIKSLGLPNINVACENSPNSITVSGDEHSIDRLAAELESRSVFNRKLRVDVAYHSAHMQVVAADYMAAIKDVQSEATGCVKFYSSLLGRKLENTVMLGASYWIDNLTKPVLFSSALQEMYSDAKPDIIVEIGPHAALEGPIKQILKSISQKAATEVKYFPSLVRSQHATTNMLKLAGNMFLQGHTIDFNAVNQSYAGAQKPAVVSDLSPYPWSDHKYWFESRVAKQHRQKPFARHDLLGVLDDNSNNTEPTWRNTISTNDIPWLKDHKMQSLSTFPLAGYLSIAVEASFQCALLRGISEDQIGGFKLRDIQASKAFILDDGAHYETLVTLRSYAEGTKSYSTTWDEFRISSYATGRGWLEHCRGLVSIKKPEVSNPVWDSQLRGAAKRRKIVQNASEADDISLDSFYSELEERGAGYRSTFTMQPGSGLQIAGNYSMSTITIPDTASCMPHQYETPYVLPTAFLDLFFQLTFPILGAGRGVMPSLFMPSFIREVDISNTLSRVAGQHVQVVAHGKPDLASAGPVDFDIDAWQGDEQEPVVKFAGFKMTPVKNEDVESEKARKLCFTVRWEPLRGCPATKSKENGVVYENDHGQDINDVRQQPNGYGHTSGTNGHSNGEHGTNGHANGTGEVENGLENGTTGHFAPVDAVKNILEDEITLIADSEHSTPIVSALLKLIELRTGRVASIVPLSKLDVSSSTRYVSLAELDTPLLYDMTAETFERVQTLLLNSRSTLWVTRGAYRFAENPKNSICQGLLRTVRSEANKAAAYLDLDPNSQLAPFESAGLILQAIAVSVATPEDDYPVHYEFAEESGELYVPRVVEQEDMNLTVFRGTQSTTTYPQDFHQDGRRLKVVVGTPGALDSLYWKDEVERSLAEGEIEIMVKSTGMNFKDVVIAMGQLASSYLGVECSGIVSRVAADVTTLKVGDRVCATSLGAYGTYTHCAATSAAVIPEDMTFETAASIPVVYCTAYYGIVVLARTEPGDKILIHAASGGVGQAAIQLAQMLGAEIFATVGSLDKKKHIMETYNIPESHIFYSRDTSFGPAVREATGGKGVDVVINSLAGDLLRETWECIAPFGRFIEIGKRDITSNTRLEMSKFEYNCTFSSVDLTLVAAERPKIMARVLTAVMDLLAKKNVAPIGPITTVGISELESALRMLQSGKTSGKVVVSHQVNEQVKVTHPAPPANLLRSDATYIIIGGTGGLGRSMTKRLVQRGARIIVLLSRSGKMTDELDALSQQSATLGASILVKPCDVGDQASVSTLMAELEKNLPPIKGVIHAAMVLKDVLFEKMKFDEYESVVRSKVAGAWNFHHALESSNLDFFVVLSSVAGIVGNRGQAAYAAANTFLDALTHFRRRKGLASTSLDLTAVEGVGYLAENSARQSQVLRSLSGNAMDEAEVLALIESAINGKVGTICQDQCITGLSFENPSSLPFYASDGRFSQLRTAALAELADANSSASSATLSIGQQLRRAASSDEAVEIATIGLRDKLGAILMLPQEVMEMQKATTSITAFGLDSLNAIELRNWIDKELQAHLQVLELLTSGGLADLAALVLRKTRLHGPWSKVQE
ncbi:Reducing polyketide synthase PKS2 [Fulvia fulva]|nr:Reducing polyketide synthase PKS2 [Fulvia fulva]WPV14812.1 Reducing polyketide synthase PKS2 [Fulvia fulva]WPV30201.1 Reducing polyketide synthase PKS2 [Fulvia fulva]